MNAAVYALAAIGALYLLLTTVATALVILAACLQRKRAQAAAAFGDAVDMHARWEAEARRLPARKPQAAPWPDGGTVVTDGMADAINRMLRGDGRG